MRTKTSANQPEDRLGKGQVEPKAFTCAEDPVISAVSPHQANPVQDAAEVSHSPLPWDSTGWDIHDRELRHVCKVRYASDEFTYHDMMRNGENTNLIVHACNAHYDLIAACEAALTALTHHQHGMVISGAPEIINSLKAAIEKATRGLP